MPQQPSNTAAWQDKVGDQLVVRATPYTPSKENEIVVKAHAWAVNPVDWILQSQHLFDWMKYPLILGNDIAGEVVEVGSAATRFKTGDRVLALATGFDGNNSPQGGFQDYVVINPVLAAPIPDSLSYAEAAVFPLGLSTAACGLFQKDFLGLQHPSVPPKPTGKTILVWGGSSSVGSNAIQLAVAAGYEVIAVASSSNFDYVKKLGASSVFDYKSETIVDDVVSAITATDFAGIFQAAGSIDASVEIASKAKAKKDSVFIASAMPVPENKPSGVEAKMVWGSSLKDNEVGPAIYEAFLPKALAQGSFIPAPEPWVIGKGLESIQAGFDAQKRGVSAKKVVIVR